MNNKFAVGMLILLLSLTASVGYLSYTYIENEKQAQADAAQVPKAIEQPEKEGNSDEDVEKNPEEKVQKGDKIEASEQQEKPIDETQTVSESMPSGKGAVQQIKQDQPTNVTLNNNYEVPREKLDHIQEVINKTHPETVNKSNTPNSSSNRGNPSTSSGQSSASTDSSSTGTTNRKPTQSEANQGNSSQKPSAFADSASNQKPSTSTDSAATQKPSNTTNQTESEQPTTPEIIYDRNYITVLIGSLKKEFVTISQSESTNKEFHSEICYKATVTWEADATKSYECWIGTRTLKVYDKDGEMIGTVYSDFNEFFS